MTFQGFRVTGVTLIHVDEIYQGTLLATNGEQRVVALAEDVSMSVCWRLLQTNVVQQIIEFKKQDRS